MIPDRRKLWLMCACNVRFTLEKQKKYADRFVKGLKSEEVEFCLDYLKRSGNSEVE